MKVNTNTKTPYIILCLIPALLSACAVTTGVYRTIALDEAFESNAEKIEVTAPTRRYKPSFYNVKLGAYQAANVAIEKATTTKSAAMERKPEKRITVDNTFWNLILNRELNYERVTYDQYRIDEEGGFSFRITQPDGPDVQSDCFTAKVFLENTEVSRTQIGLLKPDNTSSVKYYGDWLASRLVCTINSADQSWTFEVLKNADRAPELRIERQDSKLDLVSLAASTANGPAMAGRQSAEPAFADNIAGVAIRDGNRQLAAASLVGGNTMIWLDLQLTDKDRAMVVAVSYGLILESWLTD